jgi:hypothetical protein
MKVSEHLMFVLPYKSSKKAQQAAASAAGEAEIWRLTSMEWG